jgi:halocyanin-like protein
MQRRSVLKRAAVAALSITGAGCLGGSGGDPPREPEVEGWFAGVSNYDGFVDRTSEDEVTVKVGAGEARHRFAPPAITVAPDTTVVFEWTGKGSGHNVQHHDEEWANPSGVTEEGGHTWERTFSEPGTHRYVCWPHRGVGMKGAVFVDADAAE